MKQRMAEIGGECVVASRPGEGCQVSFGVPLKQQSLLKRIFRSRGHNDFEVRAPLSDKYIPVPVSKV
jgi:hypothetical protein